MLINRDDDIFTFFGLELVTTQSTCRFPDICFLILLYNKPTELKSTTKESFI